MASQGCDVVERARRGVRVAWVSVFITATRTGKEDSLALFSTGRFASLARRARVRALTRQIGTGRAHRDDRAV